MEFPVYKEKDLVREIMDGDNYNSDFAKLIEELYERDEFENDIEKGIAAKVIAEGTYNLSKNQSYHVQNIFDRYNDKRCSLCGDNIPLNEVLYLEGSLCSYHQNQSDID